MRIFNKRIALSDAALNIVCTWKRKVAQSENHLSRVTASASGATCSTADCSVCRQVLMQLTFPGFRFVLPMSTELHHKRTLRAAAILSISLPPFIAISPFATSCVDRRQVCRVFRG